MPRRSRWPTPVKKPFPEDSTGTTTMVDRIEFVAPLGLLGRLVEKLVLTPHLQQLIESRNRHLVGARLR